MERGKTLLWATLALFALLVGCGDDEEVGSTQTSQAQTVSENAGESAEGAANHKTDVGQAASETQIDVGNGADVTTGLTGTTSGITGSDMVEPDETIGEGLSSRDQMPVSDPVAQDMPPNESTPEEQAPGNPASGGQDGVPQASSSNRIEVTKPEG